MSREFFEINAKKLVYLAAVVVAVIGYFSAANAGGGSLTAIKITEFYGFSAIIFLYLSLVLSPLYIAFPNLPIKKVAFTSRPALGISAFFFALVHGSFGFFELLGGFEGLGFLSGRYLVAISLGAVSLLILASMAASSNKRAKVLLGRGWKRLHRFVYLAGLLVVVHVLMLGSHFTNISRAIPRIFNVALLVLLALELYRIDKFVRERRNVSAHFGVVFAVGVVCLSLTSWMVFGSGSTGPASLGVHSKHLQALQSEGANRRYTVSVSSSPTVPVPGQEAMLSINIFDATTGVPVTEFTDVYTKQIHLVLVDNAVMNYQHLHPEFSGSGFTVPVTVPHAGRYHLYFNFEPKGGIEQQIATSLQVGSGEAVAEVLPPVGQLTRSFGSYSAQLYTEAGKFFSADMTTGTQQIVLHLTDAKGNPVKNLHPYLGAWGHFVMVREGSYEYVHVHPLEQSSEGSTFGPDITFSPLGLTGPITPGIYHVFVQVAPGGTVITTDFRINVE